MTLKKEEVLNQWLYEQLKIGLIIESKSRYVAPCFYIPEKDGLLWLVQNYRKLNKRQDSAVSNRRSDQQTERGQVFQQA